MHKEHYTYVFYFAKKKKEEKDITVVPSLGGKMICALCPIHSDRMINLFFKGMGELYD